MIRHLLCGTSMILATPGLADPLTYANGSGGTATFYGQLNPAYITFDDGKKTHASLSDSSASNSRIGVFLENPTSSGLLTFRFEAALGLPASSAHSQNSNPVWEWDETKIRHVDVSYSGSFGKLSLGQGGMASDGNSGADFSGTGLAQGTFRPDYTGGYFLRDAESDELSDVKISSIFNDYDGPRRTRIRYDTPDFNGLTFGVAWGRNLLSDTDDADYYDIGLSWNGESGGVKMAAGAGYLWKTDDGDTSEQYALSFALHHIDTGLTGRIAAGGAPDGGTYSYVKAGWKGVIWGAGQTALSADYYSGKGFVSDGSRTTSWGVQAVQKIDKANLEAYLGYTSYSFDEKTTEYHDASSTNFGMRWKF